MSTYDPSAVVTTDDGTTTIFSPQFEAHYHSTHGAVQESAHIFIKEGLDYYVNKHFTKEVAVLEYGMGTALNVWLTQQYARTHKVSVEYHTLEGYPLSNQLCRQLDFNTTDGTDQLIHIHELTWEKEHQLDSGMTLYKEKVLFERYTSSKMYDIIYFDPFGPQTQPHLWESDFLSKVYDRLNTNGLLVTFCAKGTFKRALKSLRFEVEGIAGPPGKREITRATKIGKQYL